jgi:hypothetical protein
MGNVARGRGSAIDDVEGSWCDELGEGEVVTAGKLFVYESISGSATVNQGVGPDHIVFVMEGTRSYEVLAIHFNLIDYRDTR